MKVFLINYKTHSKYVLKFSGYFFRPEENDFIREDMGGRFHAKILDRQAFDIHFDLYVENRHVVFSMPETLNRERIRILRRIWHLKNRDILPHEWRLLQDRYAS